MVNRVRYQKLDLPLLFAGQEQPQSVLLGGASEVFYLSHAWQADLVARGFDVHVVDCAIRFNPFLITEEAFRMGIAPEELLTRLKIRRAFTPYQILDAALEALSSPLKSEPSVHFFLAPCKQFFDGDVADDEGLFLLKKLVARFSEFAKAGKYIIMVEKNSYRHKTFVAAYQKMGEIADRYWNLEGFEVAGQGKKTERAYRLRKMQIY